MPRPSSRTTFNGRMNVEFISIRSHNIFQQHPMPTPRHPVFAFQISTLFNFLDLQYQVNGIVGPFQTHPRTMYAALASMVFYCFAYAAELEPRFTHLGRRGVALLGSILSVSLASVLYHMNTVSLVLYSLYVLFWNWEMLCSVIESFCGWIHRRNTLVSENSGGQQSENLVELSEIVCVP